MKTQLLLVSVALAAACSPKPDAAHASGAAPPAAQKAAAPQRWTTYADPSEHAFTLEVPQGWTVTGGSRRVSAVDIRTGILARSPDGAITLFYGDANVPNFVVPNALMARGGFREGSVYSPGFGQSMVVARYEPGDVFAADWGHSKFGCGQTAAKALPQATQAIDMAYAQGGVRTSIKAGEASFACNGRSSYVFAGTELVETGMGGPSQWDVRSLAAFDATPAKAQEASALLAHMAASFRVDANWAAHQQGLTASVSHIVSQTNEAVSKSISDSFANHNAVQDKAMKDFSQATRGTATFDDPVEGRRELSNAAHQWRTPDGRTIATDTANPPVPGAVELQRVR